MSGILIAEDSRQRLAWILRTHTKPDEIDFGVWSRLIDGSIACLPFTVLSVLCDCFGYSAITCALAWPEREYA